MRRLYIKYVMNTKKYSGCFNQWFGTEMCKMSPQSPLFIVFVCISANRVDFNLVHTLGRRTAPIFHSHQWCSTRLRFHVHRDFYRSCVRLPPGNCSCEVCLLTTSDTPFQKSSLLLLPCNLYQLYHPRRNSDILVKYVV